MVYQFRCSLAICEIQRITEKRDDILDNKIMDSIVITPHIVEKHLAADWRMIAK
jgi:hypothetical protein